LELREVDAPRWIGRGTRRALVHRKPSPPSKATPIGRGNCKGFHYSPAHVDGTSCIRSARCAGREP
jgi:hypothetical protein